MTLTDDQLRTLRKARDEIESGDPEKALHLLDMVIGDFDNSEAT
jgi:hypothetical protein